MNAVFRWTATASALALMLGLSMAMPGSSLALDIGMTQAGTLAEQEEEWDVMEKSGADVFRLMLPREYHGGGSWTWFDEMFTRAAERGIRIQPYLYDFSQQFPTKEEWQPPENEWETWVYEVVHRYGYGGEFWSENSELPYRPVSAWEVWNEPNLKQNNPGGGSVQPENYAGFLKRTGAAIQAAQNEVSGGGTLVLMGGLLSRPCNPSCTSSSWMSVDEFLDKADNISEVGTRFNGLSLHPYSHRAGVAGLQSFVNAARTSLTTHFSSSKSLWITELGWTLTDVGQSYWVSAKTAAENLTGSFEWIKSVATEKNIQELIWFMYRSCECGLSWANWTGLRWISGAYTPAWYAYQQQTGAGIWPTGPWATDNLGGDVRSDPDISSWEYGRLDFFARGPSGELVHKLYNGSWSGWENLGGNLVSGPGAVSWGPKRIDVFARSEDNSVIHWAWNGSEWATDNIGGEITSDPDIASWGYGRLDIFARGPSGELVHKQYDGGQWGEWESIGSEIEGGPGAVSWGEGRIDVAARTSSNTVAHWAWSIPTE